MKKLPAVSHQDALHAVAVAKKVRETIRAQIQSVFENEAELKDKKNVFEEVYGLLDDKTAKEMLNTIRHKDSKKPRIR